MVLFCSLAPATAGHGLRAWGMQSLPGPPAPPHVPTLAGSRPTPHDPCSFHTHRERIWGYSGGIRMVAQPGLAVLGHATAKSRQSCPTLCDPIDGSPSGSPCPWDSPGKNTGVGCHFLLQCMQVKSESDHPEPSSLLPPHTIPLGRPSAPAPSIQYPFLLFPATLASVSSGIFPDATELSHLLPCILCPL